MSKIQAGLGTLNSQEVDINLDGVLETPDQIKQSTQTELVEFRKDLDVQAAEAQIAEGLLELRAGGTSGLTEAEMYLLVEQTLGATPSPEFKNYVLSLLEQHNVADQAAFEALDADDAFDVDEILAPEVSITGAKEAVFDPALAELLPLLPDTLSEPNRTKLVELFNTSITKHLAAFEADQQMLEFPALMDLVEADIMEGMTGGKMGEALVAISGFMGSIMGGGEAAPDLSLDGLLNSDPKLKELYEKLEVDYQAYAARVAESLGIDPASEAFKDWQRGKRAPNMEELKTVPEPERTNILRAKAALLDSMTYKDGIMSPDTADMHEQYIAGVKDGTIVDVEYTAWKKSMKYDGFWGPYNAAGKGLAGFLALAAAYLGFGDEELEETDAGQDLVDDFNESIGNTPEAAESERTAINTYLAGLDSNDFENAGVNITSVFVSGGVDTGEGIASLGSQFESLETLESFVETILDKNNKVLQALFERGKSGVSVDTVKKLMSEEFSLDANGNLMEGTTAVEWSDYVSDADLADYEAVKAFGDSTELLSLAGLPGNVQALLGVRRDGDLIAGAAKLSRSDITIPENLLNAQGTKVSKLFRELLTEVDWAGYQMTQDDLVRLSRANMTLLNNSGGTIRPKDGGTNFTVSKRGGTGKMTDMNHSERFTVSSFFDHLKTSTDLVEYEEREARRRAEAEDYVSPMTMM